MLLLLAACTPTPVVGDPDILHTALTFDLDVLEGTAEIELLPAEKSTALTLEVGDLEIQQVKVEGEAVAFALIRPDPGPTLPGPLLLSLAAPGQNSSELRQFFREVVRQERVQALWGRSDDAMLLEVVLLEGWKLLSQGPLLILDAVETQEVVPGIEVRHLLPSDLDDVGRLMAGIPEAPEELRDRDELRKQLQDRILDGVLVDQKLVGVARLMPQHHPAYVGLDVHILPSHRQRGLGRLLGIEVAHDELNAGRVLVSAFRSEEVARRRLVESMGAKVAALYYLAIPPWGMGARESVRSTGSRRDPGVL